jgi:hypothetical protein
VQGPRIHDALAAGGCAGFAFTPVELKPATWEIRILRFVLEYHTCTVHYGLTGASKQVAASHQRQCTMLVYPRAVCPWTATAKDPPLDQRFGLFHGGGPDTVGQGPGSVLAGQTGREGKGRLRGAIRIDPSGTDEKTAYGRSHPDAEWEGVIRNPVRTGTRVLGRADRGRATHTMSREFLPLVALEGYGGISIGRQLLSAHPLVLGRS